MPPRSRKRKLCLRMLNTGRCNLGDDCAHSHDLTAAVSTLKFLWLAIRVLVRGSSAAPDPQLPQGQPNNVVPSTSSVTAQTVNLPNASEPRPNARSRARIRHRTKDHSSRGQSEPDRANDPTQLLSHLEQERLLLELEGYEHLEAEGHRRHQQTEAEAMERQPVAKTARAQRNGEPRERRRQQQVEELERQRRAAEDRERQRLVEEAAAKARQQAKLEEQAAEILQTVVSGSIVTFSAGLAVQHVVTGFECCKILVRNLPQNVRDEEIVGLLARYGLDAEHFHVTDRHRLADKWEVSVVAKADAASQLRASVDELELRGEPLDVEFGVFNGIGGMGGGAEERSIVRTTFFAPSARFVATYNNRETAERHLKDLQDKNLGGRPVRLTRGREGNTLVLNNISLKYLVDAEAISGFARTPLVRALPCKITDVNVAIRRIEAYAQETSIDIDCEVLSRGADRGGLVRLLFTCPSWEVAKQLGDHLQAVTTHHNSDFYSLKLRVIVPPAVRFTMVIPSGQYRAQRAQWNELDSGIQNRKACFLEFKEFNRGDHRVEVAGTNKLAVGRLKVQAERIAAGIRVSGWHPSLARPDPHLLDQVTQAGAFLKTDSRQQTIKLYGTNEAVATALELVEAKLERFAATAQALDIPASAARFFLHEGIDQLKALLDDNTIAYNAASRQVTVKGGDVARRAVQRLIEQAANWVAPASESADDLVCNICFDTPTAPMTMLCDHVYCTGCLRHLFGSVSDGSSLPVRCMGDEAKCTSHFPIALIREFMAPDTFDDILALAFAAHTDRHPTAFRPCRTPDCNQLYRPRTVAEKLSCPSCCSMICAKCGEDWHDGMSCEQAELANSKDEQERLTEEYFRGQQVVKRCPTCKTPIFKTEGCNHMTCKCGAHFCWRCLVVTTEDSIYTHMEEVHGGMYDPDPPPSPIPAPALVLPQIPVQALPQGNALAYYVEQARAPFRPADGDLINSDDEEDPQNPLHGVDLHEQQELLRQAALIRNRTQAARQEAARNGPARQVGAGPAAVNVAPRPAPQPEARPVRPARQENGGRIRTLEHVVPRPAMQADARYDGWARLENDYWYQRREHMAPRPAPQLEAQPVRPARQENGGRVRTPEHVAPRPATQPAPQPATQPATQRAIQPAPQPAPRPYRFTQQQQDDWFRTLEVRQQYMAHYHPRPPSPQPEAQPYGQTQQQQDDWLRTQEVRRQYMAHYQQRAQPPRPPQEEASGGWGCVVM